MAKYSARLKFFPKRDDNWNYRGSDIIKYSSREKVNPTEFVLTSL